MTRFRRPLQQTNVQHIVTTLEAPLNVEGVARAVAFAAFGWVPLCREHGALPFTWISFSLHCI